MTSLLYRQRSFLLDLVTQTRIQGSPRTQGSRIQGSSRIKEQQTGSRSSTERTTVVERENHFSRDRTTDNPQPKTGLLHINKQGFKDHQGDKDHQGGARIQPQKSPVPASLTSWTLGFKHLAAFWTQRRRPILDLELDADCTSAQETNKKSGTLTRH